MARLATGAVAGQSGQAAEQDRRVALQGFRPEAIGTRGASLEQLAKLLSIESGVVEDAREGSSLKLAMQRDRQRDPAIRVLHPRMAAALAHELPPVSFERP